MKSATLVSLCVMMSLGLALANYGGYGYTSYMPVHPGAGSGGDGGFLMLIGLLFLLMILFSNNGFFNYNNNSSSSGTPVYVIGG